MTFWWRKPKHEMTLRATMNQVLLVTLALVAVVSVGVLFAYAQIKQTLVTHSLVADIEKDAAAQVEALMPSFLVPEQRSGATILLERFKAADGLESISILPPGRHCPHSFGLRYHLEATHCNPTRTASASPSWFPFGRAAKSSVSSDEGEADI